MSIDFIDAVPKYRLVRCLRTHTLSCTFTFKDCIVFILFTFVLKVLRHSYYFKPYHCHTLISLSCLILRDTGFFISNYNIKDK